MIDAIIPPLPGICYSGFRAGQSPKRDTFPSKKQIEEDLALLCAMGFRMIRLYEPNAFSEMVLQLIKEKRFPLRVMLGIDSAAEYFNPNCPWKDAVSNHKLAENRKANEVQLERMCALANEYRQFILALAVGNENRPAWGADLLEEARLITFANYAKQKTGFPITYCEGAWEWKSLRKLADVLDVICIHTYPQWNRITCAQAVQQMMRDYTMCAEQYLNKQIVISEFGWCTHSNSCQVNVEEANEIYQSKYIIAAVRRLRRSGISAFIFEAFDEPWKGSTAVDEPEKYWGICTEGRNMKPAAEAMKNELQMA